MCSFFICKVGGFLYRLGCRWIEKGKGKSKLRRLDFRWGVAEVSALLGYDKREPRPSTFSRLTAPVLKLKSTS
jgi:hypothetical protein